MLIGLETGAVTRVLAAWRVLLGLATEVLGRRRACLDEEAKAVFKACLAGGTAVESADIS